MSAKRSAGLLMYRITRGAPQVLLAHPGGPFWINKDLGAWTIPKGVLHPGEDALRAAEREFTEETGLIPCEPFFPLGCIKQKSGKIVEAWAFEGDCDPLRIQSNMFELEWPPKSGCFIQAPEVDRAAFFSIEEARRKLNPSQSPFLDALMAFLQKR